MKLEASAGRASEKRSITTFCRKITLIASTEEEGEWLSRFFKRFHQGTWRELLAETTQEVGQA